MFTHRSDFKKRQVQCWVGTTTQYGGVPCTSIQQSRSWQSKTNLLFRDSSEVLPLGVSTTASAASSDWLLGVWQTQIDGDVLLHELMLPQPQPPTHGCRWRGCFFLFLFFFFANFVENKFTGQAMTTRNVWGLVLAFERVQMLYLLLLVQTFCVRLPQMLAGLNSLGKHTCKVFVLWPTVADCVQWHKKKVADPQIDLMNPFLLLSCCA